MPFASGHHRKVAAPTGIIRDGLQSRWPMDDGSGTTVVDDQGSNDGTMLNMSEEAWVSGIGIGPYSLDFRADYGSNAAVICGVLVPANPNALTVCCRIFPRDVSQVSLLDNGDSPGNRLYRLAIASSGFVQILMGDNSGNWGLVWTTSCSPAINTNQHLGFTWDGSIARCYLNGIEEDTEPNSNSLTLAGTENCVLGNLSAPPSAWKYNGIMDDARVYSRALSPAEMQQISAGTG